jgi:hypothetical protein
MKSESTLKLSPVNPLSAGSLVPFVFSASALNLCSVDLQLKNDVESELTLKLCGLSPANTRSAGSLVHFIFSASALSLCTVTFS